MKKYLEGEFVDNVIELFASEDPHEHEYLKTILLESMIRQSIANCCHRIIYEQYTVSFDHNNNKTHKTNGNKSYYIHSIRNENGIAEFFEIFHEQLVACCVQFVFKDPSVAC